MITDLDRVAATLLGAQSYVEVFGKCPGDTSTQTKHIKTAYRTLARAVHPDYFAGTDQVDAASDAFAALEQLKRQALEAANKGTYGTVPGFDLTTKHFSHRVSTRFNSGDIADLMQVSTTNKKGEISNGLFKVVRSPRDNDLLETEASALKKLRDSGTNTDFHPFFPQLVDSLKLRSNGVTRRANVIAKLDGFYSLEQMLRAFSSGLDPLHMAWIWRRVLYLLGYAHELHLVHGAVLPPHIMVHPEQHGVVLVDWAYASAGLDGGYQPPLKLIVPAYANWYPEGVTQKQTPSPNWDIAMAARSMAQLMGGSPLIVDNFPNNVPEDIQTYFTQLVHRCESTTPLSAFDLLDEFDTLLKRLGGSYYPRRFRKLHMPTGV